jgi:exodeoxyribonuclease V alpha subunit
MKGETMIERLKALALAGRIRQLDLQFARLVADLGGSPELVLGAALACHELGRGHVCLPLAMLAQGGDGQGSSRPFGLDPDQSRDLLADLADPASWPALFAASPLVGSEQEEGEIPRWPLRLWGDCLYLTRYHDFELGVARHLSALSERAEWPEIAPALSRLFARDYGLVFGALLKARLAPDFSVRHFVEKYLDLVFPHEVEWPAVETLLKSAQAASELERLDTLVPEALCCNGQKLAAATAAARPFAVISGGPGTGKTTTVAKLLAILVETGLQGGKAPAIRLVAPTGKAAARLTESIGAALQALDLPPEWVEAIPTEAGTLHRLLGVIPGRSQFRHHRGNPLHLDLLVVDEASMVDLPMMARLLDALPRHARLILLGDKDQLASVEAGAVLGDICSFIEQGISPAQADWLSRQTGYRLQGTPAGASVRDSLCLLSKSWRFDQHSGIGQLARACNSGDGAAVDRVFAARRDHFDDLHRLQGRDHLPRRLHVHEAQAGQPELVQQPRVQLILAGGPARVCPPRAADQFELGEGRHAGPVAIGRPSATSGRKPRHSKNPMIASNPSWSRSTELSTPARCTRQERYSLSDSPNLPLATCRRAF